MPQRPPTIGITGNIGSGKSTVAAVFARHGAEIIEGDTLGRQAVDQFPNFRKWLRERFGEDIFHGDELDRSALGRIVFRDPAAKAELDRRIWPLIRRLLEAGIAAAHEMGRPAVVDAAMIYEWGDEARYDRIVAVLLDPAVAAERAARRMQLSPAEILDRYRMQIPVEEKQRKADDVLWNRGSREELERAAERLWRERIAPLVQPGRGE